VFRVIAGQLNAHLCFGNHAGRCGIAGKRSIQSATLRAGDVVNALR
jgi:hypothetical protein